MLPASVTARVSVEAGIALTWRGIVGDNGRCVSIEHFGASADYKTLFQKFGITADAVVAAARERSRPPTPASGAQKRRERHDAPPPSS